MCLTVIVCDCVTVLLQVRREEKMWREGKRAWWERDSRPKRGETNICQQGEDKYLQTRRRQILLGNEYSQGCGEKDKYQRSRQDRKAASKVRKTESKTWNVVFRQIDPFDNLLNKANKYWGVRLLYCEQCHYLISGKHWSQHCQYPSQSRGVFPDLLRHEGWYCLTWYKIY